MAFGKAVVWPATGGPGTGWMWGRRADLFWIGGGGFLAAVVLLLPVAFLGGGSTVSTTLLHLALLCNYPHYGATYQIIVRERKIKPGPFRWMLISTPLMLGVLVLGALSTELWGLLVRLYLTWSAQHYAAQNFGLAAMYSTRHGNALTDREKLPLQGAFLGLAAVTMIGANTLGGDPELAARIVGGRDTEHIPLAGFPPIFYQLALLIGAVSVGAFFYARHLVHTRTGKGFEPVVWLLFATTFVWFVIPQLRRPDGTGWMPAALMLTMLGVPPFFHCAQYLAVTFHRTRWSGDARPIWIYAGLCAAGFLLFHALVPLLPLVFGITHAHSVLLIITVVNLHHFWMDGLMWRRPKKAAAAAPAAQPAPAPAVAG